MKILYAIQGTGNGHIARAFDVIPQLQRHGQVDLLVSGTQCDIQLPWEVKYRLYGLSFIFGQKGGVDTKKTLRKLRPFQLLKEIYSVPVHKYDLVINDFEPVTAWACKLRNVKCIGLSHQSAVLHPQAPKPTHTDTFGKVILKYYAPISKAQGFHFQNIDNQISTPVIRNDIRQATITKNPHYTVYLPSYSDAKIIRNLALFPDIEWQVFSKHTDQSYTEGNVHITPVNKERFTQSLVSGSGVVCNAGFETPAEALFLGKKLCVIPMKGQYEQHCNAAFLEAMGVTRLNSFTRDTDRIRQWLDTNHAIQIKYPDYLADVIDELVTNHAPLTYPEFAMY